MADVVKRPYDNSRRLAQTRATRAQVVRAARDLFVGRGYLATTIEAIGEAADVPLATIYRLFGSKVAILKSVLDVTFGGDDDPVAFGDRPNVRTALAEDDPTRLLDAFARIAREFMDRSAPMLRVLASAGEVDAEAADLLSDIRRQRLTGQARIVDALARSNALGDGLVPPEAVDIVYLLMSPETHRILTVERGWTPDHYQQWLTMAFKALLRAPRDETAGVGGGGGSALNDRSRRTTNSREA